MKVLIVDDNQDITALLSRYLNSKGIDNDVTNDPRDGLKRIKEEHYDTVLLDISMPEFSGIDIIHTLEREKRLQDQKIVIFSAISFTDNEIHHLLNKEGVQVCIKKPIKLSKLLTTIAC
ncbi:MAG TPA: response regulator [Nitrosopumilaceae archaeon]|jgi:two-component system capsular synthesis sensor histidine kinase RcsC|nr:response regulator [Nitrosopumilaceae archaeon]